MTLETRQVDVARPFARIATIRGVHGVLDAVTPTPDEINASFIYQLSKSPLAYDWAADRQFLASLRKFDGVVFHDVGLAHIDSLFRLRALQLAAGEGPFEAACVIFVSSPPQGEPLAPGLGRRIAHSWPFRSVLFVGDGDAAAALETEGAPVIATTEAERLDTEKLLAHPLAKRVDASPSQEIGVHIQPAWGRCGSSTAFANQLDCLVDRGLFTIRIFVDDYRRPGATSARSYPRIFAANVIDASPNLETSAFLGEGGVPATANACDAFESLARRRTQAEMPDRFLAALASRAKYVIANHAHSVGFAMRLCPDARIVLDTHDYLSRNAVDRARDAEDAKAFPNCATLRKHVALERLLWQASDVCATVSHDEEKRVGKSSSHCLMVLPRSYAKRWVDPGADAVWDLLLVADAHFFNFNSVEWFLTNVVVPSERLKRLRIAVVGSIKGHLEPAWKSRLPNVHWLGYVRDLDETRNQSRLAVCPDRGGTGISIKALTAIATGQPMVATSVALRGLPEASAAALPVFDDPTAMAQDIFRLLDDPAAARERSAAARHVLGLLQRDASYDAAIDLAAVRTEKTETARKIIADQFRGTRANPPNLSFENGKISLDFRSGGAADYFLGVGWHHSEAWGRWMDGERASLRVPTAWFERPAMFEIGLMNAGRQTRLALSCGDRVFKPYGRLAPNHAAFWIDESLNLPGCDMVTFDLVASSSHCPADEGKADERVLGAAVVYCSVSREPELDRTQRIDLSNMGQAEPFLLSGWHFAEQWGRWTDGDRALLRLPANWFKRAERVKIHFLGSLRPVDVEVKCSGHRLASLRLTRDCSLLLRIDASILDGADGEVILEVCVGSTFRPSKQGDSGDDRVLGARVATVEVIPAWNVSLARWWRRLLALRPS